MFIFDSFIGNFDRNPSNWGIIYNTSNKNYKIAPIYDCGSSMHPKTPRQKILEYFNEFEESTEYINEHAISTPKSFFQINNKKINYYNFLVEKEFNQDKDIAEAILRVVPKLVEIQENGYIEKLVDSLSELMGEDRAKVLKIELEYKAQHMFKEMIRIANKVLEKQKEFNQDKDIAEAILRVVPKLVEIQENGYIEKLVDSLSELMGEDRAKVLKIELEYKAQHMFKEMIRIANKVLEKQKEKEIDDDWER